MSIKPATILGSELHTIKSKHTGKRYRITIGLPYAYYDKPSKKWPVIYISDGNWMFGMATEIVRYMSLCETTTDALIVGIGYPQNRQRKRAGDEDVYRRDFDLTPVSDEKVEKDEGKYLKRKVVTGGAGKFLKFIQNELVPFVEKRYKTNPRKRILAGHSFGGLFATFVLFENPKLFKNYIISSPSLWYHDKHMFKIEDVYSKRHKQLQAQVFLSAGELEENTNSGMASNMLRFAALLKGRNYKSLTLVQKIFNGENHCEVVAPALQAGLKWALKK